ncbi:MAG: putative sugar transporter, sugar-binding protein [Deltaproteobacteria bacterium]|nr:putative sugar transporter, sugar-binding protein [Deltaproteobacteria bacterium]
MSFAGRWAALPLAVLLLGCRSHPSDTIAIDFWAMGREGEVVQELLAEFERYNPGIHTRVQQIPWSAAHEKLLTAFVGDAMPDIVQVGNSWIPEFVALNAVEPLDTRMRSSATVAVADYFPGILDTNVISGHTYGVPWYVDTRLLFYRTDSLTRSGFGEPPTTWSAWIEVMSRIKASSPDNYAILLPLTEWQMPVILALQLGADLLRDDDQYGDFRSAAFRHAFTFYLDLFRRGLAPQTGEAQVANLYQDFTNGFFAMYVSGPWNIGEFERRLPESMAGKWGTAPLPGPGVGRPGVSIAGGASLALFRGGRHKDAAWKVIEYLSQPEQQLAFYRLTGDLPARRSAWRSEALAQNPSTQAFWQQLQHVRSTPKIPEWERIADKISAYAESAIRERMTPEAALGALDTDVDAILEKRRWLRRRAVSAAAHHAPDEGS